MVDNIPRPGDPGGGGGRPPQALSPPRGAQPGPQEAQAYLSLGENGNPPPRSPSRTTDDEYDFQMGSHSLNFLKAQLKACSHNVLFLLGRIEKKMSFFLQTVTHERDMLKKDVKKITIERDGALKHLELTTSKF